jgi:hypothetical protein
MTQANTSSTWPRRFGQQYTNICTNPKCPHGLPHYEGFGKPAHRNCGTCGQPMRRIQGEPAATKR